MTAKKNVIIIGKNPLGENLIQQYKTNGCVVEHHEKLTIENIDINDFVELCLLPETGEDNKAISLLDELAASYDIKQHNGKRLICHLQLQDTKILRMLQTCDLCDRVRQKIDIYPFTMDEVWSRSIVLDYEPITVQSEKHVHLVIFGMGGIAEMVAIQAAHIAHYPNYIHNHSLRTRITIVDGQAEQKSEKLVKQYQHLFDNSYYRIVKPSEENAVTKFHKPMYEGIREDFVDVEWEFVEAESWNIEVREKLRLWATDKKQLLTVVMADKDNTKNQSEALLLPQELYKQQIPIYIYNQGAKEYDVTLPLVKMAMNVNFIYDQCYNENYSRVTIYNSQSIIKYAVEIDAEERGRLWAKLSNVKRMSCIYNAMTIPTKMRSIGLEENDWDKFYDISQQDIELLAQVEHNRWSVEELILGFRPCTDEEQKKIATDVATQKDAYKARKIHYDLRAYKDLKPDKTGRGVQVYDICLSSCLPLIAKDIANKKGGEM